MKTFKCAIKIPRVLRFKGPFHPGVSNFRIFMRHHNVHTNCDYIVGLNREEVYLNVNQEQ